MTQFAASMHHIFSQIGARMPRNLRLLKRRVCLGGMLSAAIHLIIFVCIFTSRHSELKGIASNSLVGSGDDAAMFQSVELVRTPLKSPTKTATLENEADRSQPEPSLEVGTADDVKTSEDLAPPKPNPSSLNEEVNEASNASNPAANGSVDGTQDILTQIAKCLPPGDRPSLAEALLQLELNEAGALLTVPKIKIDLATSSKADVKSANQIIQATLQCGPYSTAQNEVRSFAFIPDFSSVP